MGLIHVDIRSRKPIYEQLTDNIRALIIQGASKPGQQLPSVRALAVELAINPNTIQKAYAELDRQGITYSLPGRGSFASENVEALASLCREKAAKELEAALFSAKEAGMQAQDVRALIDSIWRQS